MTQHWSIIPFTSEDSAYARGFLGYDEMSSGFMIELHDTHVATTGTLPEAVEYISEVTATPQNLVTLAEEITCRGLNKQIWGVNLGREARPLYEPAWMSHAMA